MSRIVFLPGFDGHAELRSDFVDALSAAREVQAVSYPNRRLGTLDAYRAHAMAQVPVDWKPVLVAESFSGLVAARWAGIDSRVAALVLCASFARNPVGYAASLGAAIPSLVKLGAGLMGPVARASGDAMRVKWQAGLHRSLGALDDDVVTERLRLIAVEDVSAELASLRVPLVVVHFEGDHVIGRAARDHLESVCHNAHVLRLPGPHFAIETRPRECAEAIGERLRAIFPAQA